MDTSVSRQLDSSLNSSTTDGESHGEASPPPAAPPQVHTHPVMKCAVIFTAQTQQFLDVPGQSETSRTRFRSSKPRKDIILPLADVGGTRVSWCDCCPAV